MKTKINELIKEWNLQLAIQNGQECLRVQGKPTQTQVAELRELKDNIITELKHRREVERKRVDEAMAARNAKLAAIEGLEELQDARNAEANYHHEVNRRFEDEALSSIMPARPKVSAKDVAAKYPRAAAYVKAEGWTYASNYAKNAAGRKAVERILEGEDYAQVLAEMDAEWSAHVRDHAWD